MNASRGENRCRGRTKAGKPCRAAATEGGLCFLHANPNKAAELGRIGGRKNGRSRLDAEPLPELNSATAVRDTVNRLIADVYAGKLNPRIAAGLAPLMQLQLRAVEKTGLEQRLQEAEQKLDELRVAFEKRDKETRGV